MHRIPPFIVTGLLMAITTFFNHLLLNVDKFNLPELYVPIAITVLTTIARAFSERTPKLPEASARGFDEMQKGYWTRVFVG